MNILDAVILGILQGITEFLPISSSGHLIIAEQWLGLPVEHLEGFDVAVHFGTLLAIIIYFRKDWLELAQSFFTYIFRSKNYKKGELHPLYFIVGTIPAIIVGLLFSDLIQGNLRSGNAVAIGLIVVALYFVFAEYVKKHRPEKEIGLKEAIIIGIAQAFALIPGVSRSGATISTGLVLGIPREKAARFSFLLGGIAILAGTTLSIIKVTKGDFSLPASDILIIGILTSFVAGVASITFLMKFLKHHTLIGFAVYRILLGLAILFF